MNESLFGKKGHKPTSAPQAPTQQQIPAEAESDFWGGEVHKPDNPETETSAIKPPETTPEATIETNVENTPSAIFPDGGQLLKPFDKPISEPVAEPSVATEQAAETLLPATPTPETPEVINTYAESSATFSRPEEPVDLRPIVEEIPAIEPISTAVPMANEAITTTAPAETSSAVESIENTNSLWQSPDNSQTLEAENANKQAISTTEAITENTPVAPETEALIETETQQESSLATELGIDTLDDDISADAYDNLDKQKNHNSDNADIADIAIPDMEAGALAGTNPAATPDAESPLQTLIIEHKNWLDSNGTDGRRAVFREDIISADTDLSHQQLSGASFRGLNIARCKFTQAQLNEADFSDCNLEGADFTAAILDNANFEQANANQAAFSAAQMPKANFSAAQLQNSNFTQAKIQEANFRDANLGGANLQQVTANLTNFRGAQLDNADLNHADLTQAIFREANLNHSNLESANLLHTNLRDASMHKVDLNSTDFSQAIEVSSDIQAQFMQSERESLKHEMEKLDHIRDELEQRERSLINEREQLQRQLQAEKSQTETKQLPDISDMSVKFKKSGRLFMIFGIGWLLLSFLLAIIMQSVFAQLESGQLSIIEMLLMGVVMLVPLLFFVVSMAKSFSLSHSLNKLIPHDPNDPV